MRTNLKVTFSEKDEAKALGARWDIARKTWYIVDRENLMPFLKWMPEAAGFSEEKAVTSPVKAPKKPEKRLRAKPSQTPLDLPPEAAQAPQIVLSKLVECGCDVLPWDDCIHTLGKLNP